MSEDDWSMEDLEAEFRERLAADRVAAARLWADAGNPELRADALAELESIAHKLAGLGRTFGFPDVTDTGRAFEISLSNRETAEAPSPRMSAAADAFLRAIARAIEVGPEARER